VPQGHGHHPSIDRPRHPRDRLGNVLLEDVSLSRKAITITLKGGDHHLAPIGRKAAARLDRYLRIRPPAEGWRRGRDTTRRSADLAEDTRFVREHGGYRLATNKEIAICPTPTASSLPAHLAVARRAWPVRAARSCQESPPGPMIKLPGSPLAQDDV
jgi:hypothetical protein